MSALNHRYNNLLLASTSDATSAAGYRVTAYAIGAVAAADSTGTTITVYGGHGIKAADKIMVGTDEDTMRTVSSITATTVVVGQAVTVTALDKILNLGADTGSTAPNYDGSPIGIYTEPDPAATTPITSATVVADSEGNYEYWHRGSNLWELVRDASLSPVSIVAGIGGGRPGEFNICDFGADPNTADSSSYIQRAMDAAGASDGTVYIPDATFNCIGLDCPQTVSIVGAGWGSVLKATTSGTVLTLDTDGAENRHRIVRDFLVDGNSLASRGIYIGQISDLAVERISIRRIATTANSPALILDGTQNSYFSRIHIQTSQRGVHIGSGASNNQFNRLQITNCAEEHLILDMGSDAYLANAGSPPVAQNRGNTFVKPQMERDRAGNATATASIKMVRIETSTRNQFLGPNTGTPGLSGWGWYFGSGAANNTIVGGGGNNNYNSGTTPGRLCEFASDSSENVWINPEVRNGATQWLVHSSSAANMVIQGGAFGFKRIAVSSGALSGATKTLSSLIPAGAVVLGVTARVTTAITGATSFDIGISGGDTDKWGATIGVTLDTSTDGTDFTDGATYHTAAAADILLTANGSSFTGGVVMVTVHYIDFGQETS